MTDLLPENTRFLATTLEGARSITWDKWLWATAPLVAALIHPAIAKLFPDWGDGKHLLTVTATRGATVPQHLWLKATPLAVTLVAGTALFTQSVILPSLALLAVGFGGAVYVSLDQRRARTQVTFFRNRFRLLCVPYQYSDIAMVVDGASEDPPGTKVLKWKEFVVSLSKTEYEILHPCLQRQGYGPSETVLDTRRWNLR